MEIIMKKIFVSLLTGLTFITLLGGCAGANEADQLTKLTVGASPTPHAEILAVAKDELAAKGYELEIVEFTDYVQPNLALQDGSVDANFFQHTPYLDSFNEEKGTTLVSAGAIHYEPFGIYPGKTLTLDELKVKQEAKIAVPNDTTNEARALLLLESNGIIKLRDGAGLTATKNDIVENPNNVEIIEIEAAQLPRSLPDVDAAVINGNFALEANLSVGKDAIATEDKDSVAAETFGNIIAVRAGDEGSDKTKALLDALQSDAVKTFINETYDGAVVPIF
jgi:D-methionine transport system substrate-binding protein